MSTLHFAGYSYNLEIMDLLTILLITDFFVLVILAKMRKLRLRLEALEKHTNIPVAK